MGKEVDMMNYYGKREGVLASTDGVAFEIYVAGCKYHPCEGCHSPHTWDFNQGRPMDSDFYSELLEYMSSKEWQFDNIVLLGGEPLDNPVEDVIYFCDCMKIFNKPLWLYTHYELSEISSEIKDAFDYIVTGMFQKENYSDTYLSRGVQLKSTNQKVNKRGEDY